MLIFEGPDLAGKTTAAHRALQRLPRHMYRHFGLLPAGFDYFHDYEVHSGHYFVQDRFHMSEVVYGSVCRGRTPLTPNLYRMVDGMLALKGVMTVIICFEDTNLLKDRYSARKEQFDLGACLAVNSAYFDIENTFDEYDMNYDFFVTLNQDEPFISDSKLDVILDAYIEREQELLNVC